MRKIACALALAFAGASVAASSAAEIGGRYATPASADGSPSGEARVLEITAHRNAYALLYPAEGSRRKRHGWGLLDGDQLAVAVSTGGPAYGVAIYHHDAGEHAWSGPWISSLDGGALLGRIRFDDGAALEGRHAVFCVRPGAGSVSGTVEIKPAADGYQLTFNLGRVVYYRAVGLLLPGDRLAVSWSFGSAPEIATYQVDGNGSLTEHRFAWTAVAGNAPAARFEPITDEQYSAVMNSLARPSGSGSSQMPLFANPADTVTEELPGGDTDAAPPVGPAAPQVKAWSYGALMRQYGNDGWAERWLERQLTLEELTLLHAALRRHKVRGSADQDAESRSIGTMIDEERAREKGRR